MSDTAPAAQNQSESSHPSEQPPAENQAKRRYIRHVMRQYSFEEKEGLLSKFYEMVESGVDVQLALARLGLTYDTIYQWRNELEAKQQREKQFENQQTEPINREKMPKEIDEISTQEKTMAKAGKKAKKTRKAKTTKVVKKKQKTEPDLKAKVKPGPTLPTKGPKAEPKAAKSKVGKPKAKATKTIKKASGKGKRYSAQEKKDILAKYNSLRDSGTNAYDAAEKVGISYITIRSWELKKGLGRRTKGSDGTQPAKTIPAKSGGLSMVLPNGNRIEGLTVEQVIKIAKST